MVTEINDKFVQIGVIHGSLVECSNDLPGIFVRTDNPTNLNYINKELGILPSDKNPGTNSQENRFHTLPVITVKSVFKYD